VDADYQRGFFLDSALTSTIILAVSEITNMVVSLPIWL
jgi:hypothetical protein